MARQHHRLVEPERGFQVCAIELQLFRALDVFAQHLAGVLHDLPDVDGRVEFVALDAKTAQEGIQQVVDADRFLANVENLVFVRRLFRARSLRRLVRLAEQGHLECLVAGHLFLVEQLDVRQRRYHRRQPFHVVMVQHALGLVGDFEAVVAVELDLDLEIAEVQRVAVEQAPRVAAADRRILVIDVDTVRTQVGQVVNPAPAVHGRVLARDVSIGIRQDPVVVQRAADRAPGFVKLADGVVADEFAVFTDNFEF